MSSLLRRIQRQVSPSQKCHVLLGLGGEPFLDKDGNLQYYANPPRNVFYQGRGRKLGVFNPQGREYLARKARDEKWGRS